MQSCVCLCTSKAVSSEQCQAQCFACYIVHVKASCSCFKGVHMNYNGLKIISTFLTPECCLSLLQGTSVNLRTIFITLTSYALRSETWRQALSCLRLPNPHIQVMCISFLFVLFYCSVCSLMKLLTVKYLASYVLTLLPTCSGYCLKPL